MSFNWLPWVPARRPRSIVLPAPPKLLLTGACAAALPRAFAATRAAQHEGVAYLVGRTDGSTTLAVAVFVPEARTTPGSFMVSPQAMAACVEAAAARELQVVVQIHSHPARAYHSDGDVEGAKLRYPGFASIVVPNYGAALPSLQGAAAYFWEGSMGWRELPPSDLIIVEDTAPWTRTNSPRR